MNDGMHVPSGISSLSTRSPHYRANQNKHVLASPIPTMINGSSVRRTQCGTHTTGAQMSVLFSNLPFQQYYRVISSLLSTPFLLCQLDRRQFFRLTLPGGFLKHRFVPFIIIPLRSYKHRAYAQRVHGIPSVMSVSQSGNSICLTSPPSCAR